MFSAASAFSAAFGALGATVTPWPSGQARFTRRVCTTSQQFDRLPCDVRGDLMGQQAVERVERV